MVGLRYEICEAPGVGSTTSWQDRVKIRDAQPASGSFTDYRRQVGRGQVTLENDYPRLSEIIDVDPDDHSNDVASTVVVYRPAQGPYAETLVAEWLVNQTPDELSESELVLNGPGMGAVMDWAIVEPWDWDGTDDFVSRFPDHIYGGRNVLVPIGESQCEPRISQFWTDATSGQWRVDVDGDTVDIDFDATASEVTTAYESLSTVTDVIVEGNGSEETPWRVTFVEPCYPTTSYTVTQNTLNAPINAGLIQLGGDVPPGWTEARPLAGNTTYGEYADFGVGTLPTPAPDGSTVGIYFDGEVPVGFSFPGVQTVPSVKPGGTYQSGVYVYVDAAGSYPMRKVIRAPSEEPLIADSGWPSTSVTGQTWTLLSASNVSIPDYLDRVIFRTSYVGTADPPRIWVTGAFLKEGMEAATAGQIMLDLLDDAQSDHAGRDAIDFIDADFDATNDSSGTAWPGPESVNIQRGQTYKRVLDSVLGRLGYEWDVVRSSTAGRWDLKVWGPGTRTTDYSAADSPSLLLGQDTLSGAASTALPRANAVTVEGAGQVFAHDEDAGSITAISRREAYQGDITYVENLDDWAGEVLDRFLDEAYAPRFEVADGSGPVPGVAYGLADALTVTTHRRRVTRQVESRGFTDTVQGGLRWTVQFGEAQFDGPVSSAGGMVARGGAPRVGAGLGAIGPVAEGVRRLLEQQDRLLEAEAPSTVTVGGGGGAPTVVVAASNASDLSKAKADYVLSGANDGAILHKLTTSGVLSSGGRLLLTEGLYEVGLNNWNVNDNIVVQGMGRDATILNGASTGTGWVIYTPQDSAEIRDLTVDPGAGNGIYIGNNLTVIDNVDVLTSSGTVGVYVQGSSCSVVRSYFTGAGTGVYVESNGDDVLVGQCRFSGGIGVHVDGAIRATIHANSFNTSYILGEEAEQLTIIGNEILDPSGFAIDLSYDFGVTDARWVVADNQIHSPGGGIRIFGDGGAVTQVTVIGNMVVDSTDSAIVLDTVADAVVNSNRIHSTSGASAILLDTCNRVVVVGNGVLESDFHGVSLVDSDDCLVEGNHITDPSLDTTDTYDGINVAGDDNTITGNVILTTGDARYGINVASGTANAYVGNRAQGTFGTSPYADSGTSSVNTWPAAGGAQGDNLT